MDSIKGHLMLWDHEQQAILAHVHTMLRSAVISQRRVAKQEIDARTAKQRQEALMDKLREMLKWGGA